MSFEVKDLEDTNLAMYKQIRQQGLQLASQVNAWEGSFQTLRAAVAADKQAELDAKKAQFVAALRASLGI